MLTKPEIEKITVGIIGIRGLPNRYGGFERFVELLVSSKVFYDTVDFKIFVEGTENVSLSKNVKLIGIGINKSERPFAFYVKSAFGASRNCQVILSCGVGISIGAIFSKIFRRRLIVNPDGIEWKRSKWNTWQRALIYAMYYPALILCDHIVFDSVALKRYFLRFKHKPSSYIPYQAIRVDTEYLSADINKYIKQQNKAYILVICRLEPENSVEEIIQGYYHFIDEYELIVVGNTNTKYYKDVLAKYSHKVNFTSGIYDQSVLNSLRYNCSLYIHGHTVGGTNPSLLEAAVLVRSKILAKNTEFNREVLGDNGVYFDTAADIIEYLRTLPSDVKEDLSWYDQRFDADTIAKGYLDVFTR